MEMCEQEGLHQVDLLTPAPVKITNEEYWAKRRGQKKLDQTNQKIIAVGMKPKKTVYQIQKQYLRDAIDDVSSTASSFDEFQKLLLEKYKISVSEADTVIFIRTERSRLQKEPLEQNMGEQSL